MVRNADGSWLASYLLYDKILGEELNNQKCRNIFKSVINIVFTLIVIMIIHNFVLFELDILTLARIETQVV